MRQRISNTTPFLQTTREFPTENLQELSVQLAKSYLDIATNVNTRTIGVFTTNFPAITGNKFFLAGNRQQDTLRQVYQFTATGNIPHGITLTDVWGFVSIYGTFTDGSVWYPLPYVNNTAANNQISLTVDATNIIISAGAGAPPTITKGAVILEWLSLP